MSSEWDKRFGTTGFVGVDRRRPEEKPRFRGAHNVYIDQPGLVVYVDDKTKETLFRFPDGRHKRITRGYLKDVPKEGDTSISLSQLYFKVNRKNKVLRFS